MIPTKFISLLYFSEVNKRYNVVAESPPRLADVEEIL